MSYFLDAIRLNLEHLVTGNLSQSSQDIVAPQLTKRVTRFSVNLFSYHQMITWKYISKDFAIRFIRTN